MTLPVDVARRVKAGHLFDYDPTGALSTVERWTCSLCGQAVLRYGANIYGGATERNCAGTPGKRVRS